MNKSGLLFFIFFAASVNLFGQTLNTPYSLHSDKFNSTIKYSVSTANVAFPNPVLLDSNNGCQPENLRLIRFDDSIDADQRIFFCEALQQITDQLNGNWSPSLKSEIHEIWQILLRENIKIFPLKSGVSSKIIAAAEAFPNNENPTKFNAGLHLRIEKSKDKSFFLAFMHEARHVYDYYSIWKNRSQMTEAELEKNGFRIMSKIYQEMPNKPVFSKMPVFWKKSWENLSSDKIESNREKKIEKFMRGSKFYNHLLKSPEKYMVGYAKKTVSAELITAETTAKTETKRENNNDSLPTSLTLNPTKTEIPQQIKELSFAPEKPANSQNPDELLRAAIINEKNLYRKMDNFVYDQTFKLQCWKKQTVSENYETISQIARTNSGETLSKTADSSTKSQKLPSCIKDLDSIKTDAAETFWAASYLDQMPVKFVGFTTLDGIPAARYTVLQPSDQKFRQIAENYPQIKDFRVFVGTIFVSVADAQIIKFWGTSFPKVKVTNSKNVQADYAATAVRQKLETGIWVTTMLNTVALTSENRKFKPYSYIAKYSNYRRAVSDTVILDDIVAAK